MVKKIVFKKRKSFTLIEMLVSIFILVVMLSVATVSINTGEGNTTVTAQADEVTGLVDELKSFAYGPEREGAKHYILIIETEAGPRPYCNKDLSSNPNNLTKNQYIICETDTKNIPQGYPTLNGIYSRVRAGSLSKDLAITKSPSFNMIGPPGTVYPIVINTRTYDGQTGYGLKYCDTNSACATNLTITLDQSGINKILNYNSILGTIQ